MARLSNTTSSGGSFDITTIETVWAKAKSIPGFNYIKKDICGATISRYEFGKTSKFGWEIDHIKPVSKGGTDDLDNLQPLHWENNRHKDDKYPNWNCKRRT